MKTYKDIINRIIEIIEYSEDRKKECPKDKISKNFSKILYQDIANERAKEFRSLLVTEMAFYEMREKDNVVSNADEKKCQFQRIKLSIEQLQTLKEPAVEDSKKGQKLEILDAKGNENSTYLNGKYKAFVYLGILGHLTMEMVIQVKEVLSQTEFNELLTELSKYGVFNQDQINQIITFTSLKARPINGIDEFIAIMVLRKDLDLRVLKEVVIKLYGYDSYHYFMDKLYQYGKISFEEYMETVTELLSNRGR